MCSTYGNSFGVFKHSIRIGCVKLAKVSVLWDVGAGNVELHHSVLIFTDCTKRMTGIKRSNRRLCASDFEARYL